jgi:predicted transcriptional regulator
MRKLGKFQQQVYDDIKNNPNVNITLIYSNNAPFVHYAGERSGHSDLSKVEKTLNRLEELGLIEIYNRRTTNCTVKAIQ